MKQTDIRDALDTLGVKVSHYIIKKGPDKYIVWARDGEAGASHADNQKRMQLLEGTVDLFTKTEYDPLFEQIQQKFNDLRLAWRFSSEQYEEDTGYIHYEWIIQWADG